MLVVLRLRLYYNGHVSFSYIGKYNIIIIIHYNIKNNCFY